MLQLKKSNKHCTRIIDSAGFVDLTYIIFIFFFVFCMFCFILFLVVLYACSYFAYIFIYYLVISIKVMISCNKTLRKFWFEDITFLVVKLSYKYLTKNPPLLCNFAFEFTLSHIFQVILCLQIIPSIRDLT